MESLRVTLLQYDISWENVKANLDCLFFKFADLAGKTDLVVLPEMFSTGFTMNPEAFAETNDGRTISFLLDASKAYNFAITGSFVAKVDNTFFNRGFFITPQGETTFYDKRHLFRMGDEPKHYTGGSKRTIVNYLGWNICLLICYDLRFPVWARNRNNEYDLLIYVANWPAPRVKVWDVLLKARAIENMAYVCGVNRIGLDGMGLKYVGQSVVINPRGEELVKFGGEEQLETVSLSYSAMEKLRASFAVWKDADEFDIK
ncbi:MAG: amidohydrolase [Bacteroidales bacterium]